MFGITSPSSRAKIVAVADIGSGSAAVAIVALRKKGSSSMLAASRVTLPIENRETAHSATAISGALAEAAQKAIALYAAGTHAREGAPKELYAVVRAPWTASVTARASEHSEKEQKITDTLISALAKKALAEQKEADTSKLLEANVSRVEINGYPTKSPAGKKGTSVVVTALISTVDMDFQRAAADTLKKAFNGLEPKFRSHTRALLALVGAQPSELRNCVIVDVANEGTSITVVRKGVINGQALSDSGVASIVHAISGSGMPEDTLSMLRLAEREQCDTDACKAVQSKLAEIEPELARGFGEHLAKLAAARHLPIDILLLADPDIAPWLARFFARIDFSQFTLTAQPFSVHGISAKDLAAWVSAEPGIIADTSLSVSAALVHIEEQL